jgi:bifunctional UDP-N-acetylglucosamine pyrophosphorylase/glucosamine-1-phosphate N-acetyltransferase
MTCQEIAVVVLAAGNGARMRSRLPKVLHPIAGRPMIAHVLDTVGQFNPARVSVVIGDDMDAVAKAAAPYPTAVQSPRLGTGHAVLSARSLLDGFEGTVVIAYGDTPLVTASTYQKVIDAVTAEAACTVAVLGFCPAEPGGYGRLVVEGDGRLTGIVEAYDATADQRSIGLCNSGVIAIDGRRLFSYLERVGTGNAKGEYYLTDIIGIAHADGDICRVVEGDEGELLGVNTRADLARAEAAVQHHLRQRAMDNGATLVDPASVYFSYDTRLGRDVTVGPNVVFGPGTVVGDDVEILGFCHFIEARIDSCARVGPFARLRPGAHVGPGAHIGNFVEMKNATLEDGAKASHLSYIGDAVVGAGANVGAGTITCNYDGFVKARTEIGAGAFIGSNTALIAPVRIGAGAIVGAGSVISQDVGDDALGLARGEFKEKAGWARDFRERQAAAKAASSKSKAKT